MTRTYLTCLAVCGLLFLVACDSPSEKATPPDQKQTTAPDITLGSNTPAAVKLARFINAVRSGQRSSLETLIREDMAGFLQEIPMEQHVNELMGFHTGFSDIAFHKLVVDEAHAARGLFQNQTTGNWVHIGVKVDKAEPHGIVVIELEPATPPTT